MPNLSCVHLRPELRVGGSPAGSRPAQDRAGCHAAGHSGFDIFVNLPNSLSSHMGCKKGYIKGAHKFLACELPK